MSTILLVVIGTRPEIIKVAPIIKLLKSRAYPYTLVWSGQHYDYEMSRIFFEELDLPTPDVFLENVKDSPDILSKLSQIVLELKRVVRKERPSAIYGLGDTTTTLATAITAAYEGIPFIHDEAGMRSFNLAMIEELNRIISDRVASIHLAPTKLAVLNLLHEGIGPSSIKLVGSALVDILLDVIRSSLIIVGRNKLEKVVDLDEDEHVITLTLHRRENLTCEKLKILIKVFEDVSKLKDHHIRIVFPIHPHTKKILEECGFYGKLCESKNVSSVRPLGYLEFVALLEKSKIVMTDSGGVQEEAFVLGKHIITLRNSTEWPETVLLGYNTLMSLEKGLEKRILEVISDKLRQEIPSPDLDTSPIGNGKAAMRIVKIIGRFLEEARSGFRQGLSAEAPYYIPLLFTPTEVAEAQELCLSATGLPTLISQEKAKICIKRAFVNLRDLMKHSRIRVEVDWRSIDSAL